MSKEAYYFSHDSNARHDPKILALRSVYGMEGYGRFWSLIEFLREQDNFKLKKTKHFYNALAMQLQCDADAAHSFVQDCIHEFELLHEDDDFIWSNSLLKRMDKRNEKSEKAKKAAEARWKKGSHSKGSKQPQSESNADAMQTQSEGNALKEKKVKESKRKESKLKDLKDNEEESQAPEKSLINILIENNLLPPGGVTATLQEDINDVIDNFGFEEPHEIIRFAIKDAVRGNGRTWKFVYTRLHYWSKQGVKTVKDAEEVSNNANEFSKYQRSNGSVKGQNGTSYEQSLEELKLAKRAWGG